MCVCVRWSNISKNLIFKILNARKSLIQDILRDIFLDLGKTLRPGKSGYLDTSTIIQLIQMSIC